MSVSACLLLPLSRFENVFPAQLCPQCWPRVEAGCHTTLLPSARCTARQPLPCNCSARTFTGQSPLPASSRLPLPGPLSSACHSLCLLTPVQRQHILKQSEKQFPLEHRRKCRGANPSLLTVLLSPWRMGDLGVVCGLHGEESSNEFLFKFFIPAEKASLGWPRSWCAVSPATKQAPAGMSSPGYGLMA